MPATVHFDGSYVLPVQHGDVVVVPQLLYRCSLFKVTYHQLRATFFSPAVRPTFNVRGPVGELWAGLPVVDISEPRDVGGGICEFVVTYAQVPQRRPETELFAFEYQFIIGGDITSVSKTVSTTLVYSYYVRFNPATIPIGTVFRAVKIGSVINGVGTVPGVGAPFLAEDEKLTRWMGDIWEKVSRYAPPLTPAPV